MIKIILTCSILLGFVIGCAAISPVYGIAALVLVGISMC